KPEELVAYFCAEFGVHESLPLYSGGLGILAGDHCKAASDFKLPFIAIGLLYRQGYFVQTIDADGRQRADYHDSDFSDLPIEPVKRKDDGDLMVELAFPGRKLTVKVWQTRVGHVRLFLLDTDVRENNERDRAIAYRLYGGDRTTRLEQELVLGVGGARALAAMELKPSVFHINEGHAAFLILERVRSLVAEGMTMEAAVEAVASNTVFTTHTPVPAGHDQFADAVVLPYLKAIFSALDVASLGRPPAGGDFNMTALALRGSRYHNGVSRIHGGVSAKLLDDYWPDLTPEENPLGYVTNGVHVTTFLAPEWGDDLDHFRRLLADKERPVLFLFSGKAHPADEPGQELIRTLVHMSNQEEFQGRLLFIEGYDLHIARRLVSGVDVWLNNPVHPLEAS